MPKYYGFKVCDHILIYGSPLVGRSAVSCRVADVENSC